MPSPRPTQESAENRHDTWLRALIRTVVLVVVDSYDNTKNTATVLQRRNPVDERGRAYETKPIRDAPVVWPRGAGWLDRGELEKGDLCVLLVLDRELGLQLTAPTGQVVDGESRLMHELSFGIVVPLGISHTGAEIGALPKGQRFIGREDESVGISMTLEQLLIEAPAIKLGEGAVAGAARLGDATSAAATMAVWIGQVQAICAALAPAVMLPPPVAPTDFGTITEASAKTTVE